MAVSSVSFSKQGNVYVSDAIDVTGNAVALQIKYTTSGGTVLERSIDGTTWVVAAQPLLSQSATGVPEFETNVTGLVTGQKLRVRFSEGVTPSSINVLQ